MSRSNEFIDILIKHVRVFQTHTHPVVHVLMKGFSKVLVREAFSVADRWKLQAMANMINGISCKLHSDEER